MATGEIQVTPVVISANWRSIMAKLPISASGGITPLGFGVREVTLFVNVKAAPTGVAPTIVFTLTPVDPGDGLTPVGAPASTVVIAGVGVYSALLASVPSSKVLVTWTVGGVAPVFPEVYASLVGNMPAASSGMAGVVVGPGPSGAPPGGDPVLVAGWDGLATRILLTDASGKLQIGLPPGAATEATLSTLLLDATFTARVPTNGQKLMAGSLPVVIASDQSTLTIAGGKSNNGGAPGANNLGVLPALANAAAPAWTEGNQVALSVLLGGALRTDNTSWLGSAAPTVGQKAMASSLPVTISSDQAAFPVTVNILPTAAAPGISFGDVLLSAITTAAVLRTAYTEQSANFQGSVVSSSASDAAAGVGARTIRITYLDSTGAGPFTETVTLNGTTPVNLVSTTHCFIEKIEVLTVGSTGNAVGTISLFTGLAGGGTLVGTIAAGDKLTYWAQHYVATGKTCKVTGMNAGSTATAAGSGSVYRIQRINIPQAAQVEIPVTEDLSLYGQSSSAPRPFNAPVEIAGPARLTMYVTTTANPANTYRAAFDFFDL